MNLSLLDVKGEALIISQFTLYGDSRKGRRPSYTDASRPEHAIPLYEKFIEEFSSRGIRTQTGEFGADMKVEIHNDGPVTLMVESRKNWSMNKKKIVILGSTGSVGINAVKVAKHP